MTNKDAGVAYTKRDAKGEKQRMTINNDEPDTVSKKNIHPVEEKGW